MTAQSFGKYMVVRLLGRGGMAEVYQASDPVLDRRVAIKVILAHLASEAGFGDRFQQEAKLVANLRHPHIIQLYDYDVAGGQPFMVMEYLEGRSLKERLEELRTRGETMPLSETARLLKAIGSALDYAHTAGAVHRDIKPANILFSSRDEPVLTDFGIAKMLSQLTQLTMTGSVVGSPAYMSPEQALGKPVDSRSDIYSLGCVLYEMLTGRPPFEGDSPTAVMLQHVNTAPRPPSELNSALSPSVESVVLKSLAKDPKERFTTANALVQAFETALRGEAVDLSAANATLVQTPEAVTAATPKVDGEATVVGKPESTVVSPKRPTGRAAKPEQESATVIAPQPVAQPEIAATSEKKGRSPALIIVGVVAALAIAAGGFFLFGQGGKSNDSAAASLPLITSLTPATTSSTPGANVKIECVAADPQNLAITFKWTADGGTFVNPTGPVVEWVAPDKVGSYSITATITNPNGASASKSVSVSVSGSAGTKPPKVNLTASPEGVAPGKTAEVVCTATLQDGGTLGASNYSWSVDGGQIIGSGGKVTYVAPQQPGTYKITVTVNDGKGSEATGTIDIAVGLDQLKGAVKAVDLQTGTVWSNGQIDGKTIVGDNATNLSARAYFSFDIFPYAKRTITNATLTFRTKGITGDPFSASGLGGLYFEVVNYGANAPTAKDFESIGASPIPLTNQPVTQIDVTSQIMSAAQSADRVFQVRLRFSNRTNNNSAADFVEFTDPLLNIAFK